MPATYEPIATVTIATDGQGWDFTSIPSTYTDLRLVVYGRGTFASTTFGGYGRFNNDSGSNYSYTRLFSDGSAQSQRQTSADTFAVGELPSANASANIFGQTVIDILNYSSTTIQKTVLVQTSAMTSTSYTFTYVNLWRSTAAINRITFGTAGLNSMKAGSMATLYGIKAA
jgi:hypothetical protein